MSKNDLLKKLCELEIIYKKPVKLRSGTVSNFYCDIKRAYGYPDVLNMIANEIGRKLSKKITCIVASGYGGLPLASVIAAKFNKHLTLVREAPKDYGKKNYIDGYIPNKKDVVVIVDDVITTGSSIRATIVGLENTGAEIIKAIVVVKRGDAILLVPYSYLFTIEEILAVRNGR